MNRESQVHTRVENAPKSGSREDQISEFVKGALKENENPVGLGFPFVPARKLHLLRIKEKAKSCHRQECNQHPFKQRNRNYFFLFSPLEVAD
ncbi:hypothetical protein J437_LFUL002059 [Ladona fulva]|uniref:Uncharacterized protein n=1 Tax=Ladona fulva TaxID=123851 RepID=A0A8K0NXU3_LADFU|nr:hypothetical protein J437_LFUL002059 [Ladona fulva]